MNKKLVSLLIAAMMMVSFAVSGYAAIEQKPMKTTDSSTCLGTSSHEEELKPPETPIAPTDESASLVEDFPKDNEQSTELPKEETLLPDSGYLFESDEILIWWEHENGETILYCKSERTDDFDYLVNSDFKNYTEPSAHRAITENGAYFFEIYYKDKTAYRVAIETNINFQAMETETADSTLLMSSARASVCMWDGCSNTVLNGYRFCRTHKCAVSGCDQGKSPPSSYCQAHGGASIGCQAMVPNRCGKKPVVNGSSYCYEHCCPSCNGPKWGQYTLCWNCGCKECAEERTCGEYCDMHCPHLCTNCHETPCICYDCPYCKDKGDCCYCDTCSHLCMIHHKNHCLTCHKQPCTCKPPSGSYTFSHPSDKPTTDNVIIFFTPIDNSGTGIKKVMLPDKTYTSQTGKIPFTVSSNGAYTFVVEDNNGKIGEVTVGVDFIAVFDVTVTLSSPFVISPDTDTVVGGNIVFENYSNVPVTLTLSQIAPLSNAPQIVLPEQKDWHNLSANETQRFIALGYRSNNVDFWYNNKPINFGVIAVGEKKEYSFKTKYGYSWLNSESIHYRMNIKIGLSS